MNKFHKSLFVVLAVILLAGLLAGCGGKIQCGTKIAIMRKPETICVKKGY